MDEKHCFEAHLVIRMCLFRCLFCVWQFVFLDSFRTTVFTNGLLEPYFQLTNSFFTLCLSYFQGMFGWNLSNFHKKSLKAIWKSSTCSLFSDKALCFSLFERALNGNFTILIIVTSGLWSVFDHTMLCSEDFVQFFVSWIEIKFN